MPAPYGFTLDADKNGFDIQTGDPSNPVMHISPGQSTPMLDACRFLDAVDAAIAANPGEGGVRGIDLSQVQEECNALVSANASPSVAPVVAPNETNPNPDGGDSADRQAAPNPPIVGTGNETEDGTEEPVVPPTEEPVRPQQGEPDPNGGETPHQQTHAGDPVDIFNGAFYLEETDLEIPNTVLPMAFTRYYRSGSPSFGPIGWNWDHNYNQYVRQLNSGDIAVWKNLHEQVYTFNGSVYQPPRGVFHKLEKLSPGNIFDIKAEGGLVMHFEIPSGWTDAERIPLEWIRDAHGNELHFTYGAENKLAEVRDDDDRYFQFEYDACGLMVAVKDHAGRMFTYDHDEETMQLTRVTSPVIADHPDGISKYYHYEHPWTDPRLRHSIIRIEDHNRNVYVENVYEQDPASFSFARLTEQYYGSFLYQFRYTELQWVPANPLFINIAALRVEVMNPDFGLETYTFNYRGDLIDRRYRLNKDGSFRVVVWQYEFDEQGNPAKTTRPDGSEEIFVYDFGNADPRMRGKLLRRELTAASGFPSPSRIVWRGAYETNYQLLKEEKNESGAVTKYKYDFDITPTDPLNSGKLREIIYPDATLADGTTQSSKVTFEFNSKGQPTATILGDGSRNEIEYGSTGNDKSRAIKEKFDVGGLSITRISKYDSFGFVAEKIDGNGHSTKHTFNALGLPEKNELPAVNGATAAYIFHYDSDKKLIASEKPKGNFVDGTLTGTHIHDKYTRDILGNITGYELSANTAERRVYAAVNDYRGNAVETLNPDGSRVTKIYDERNLCISEVVMATDGNSVISKKVFDRSGRLTQTTSPQGVITKYEYDGFGRISKVTHANGTEIKNKWLADDLLESEETTGDDGSGATRQLRFKSLTYDERKRKKTETLKIFTTDAAVSSNITTTFYYDVSDRIVKTVNTRGGEREKEYDGLGRLKKETDAMLNEVLFIYDDNNNIIQSDSHHVEPDGGITILTKKFNYDARNRRVEMIEPDGSKITSEYDDSNLLVKQTDRSGVITTFRYNSHGNRINEVKDPGGLNISQSWSLDTLGKITSYTDPASQVSHFYFDGAGRNYRSVYPNGFTSVKTYNSLGQVTRETLSSGVVFEYTYDSSSRMISILNSTCPSPIVQVSLHTFQFDGLDRLITATAGSNIVRRKYDSADRIIEETTNGSSITCSYNDVAGTVDKTWPNGRKEKLTHDLEGILSKIDETVHGALGSGNSTLAEFQTSGPSHLGKQILSGNTILTSSFDERKRVTELSLNSTTGVNEKISYRYNQNDHKQVELFQGQNPATYYFEFDNKYRLLASIDAFNVTLPAASTQAEHNSAIMAARTATAAAAHQEKFFYNGADERTRYTETSMPDKNYTYVAGHRLQSDGTNSYTYNSDGSLQTDGGYSYEADALGRIVKVKSGSSLVTEINFDALGRPTLLKETGKPDRTFNYFGGFIEQENETGVESRQITLHPVTGVPIAYHISGGTYYPFFDSRFNLVALLNDAGNIVETFRYKGFGKPTIYDSSGTTITTSSISIEPVFGGQRYLQSIGFYLSKKRLMDPVNGVYLSIDPKGYLDSSSLYVYCAQDPVNNIDPNGEIVPFIIAAFVIGGALGGAGYSAYDASNHPERYEGWRGGLRVFGNVLGGAAIGGVAVVGGELVLAAGGTGLFATAGGGAALTATQSFLLYGTSSVVSGGVLRGGFNYLFPEYVNPVSPGTVAVDFFAGGAIGTGFRALTNYVTTNPVGTFPWLPPMGRFGQWLRFGADNGGEEVISVPLGAYPGRIGAWLDKVGIRQGWNSTVNNFDIGNHVFGQVDTGVHEGFHAFVSRYFPTFKNLSVPANYGAIMRYPEEVVAYMLGHGAAGRLHGIPVAPFEAFRSVAQSHGASGAALAKHFWGMVAGGAGVWGAEQAILGEDHPNGKPPSAK